MPQRVPELEASRRYDANALPTRADRPFDSSKSRAKYEPLQIPFVEMWVGADQEQFQSPTAAVGEFLSRLEDLAGVMGYATIERMIDAAKGVFAKPQQQRVDTGLYPSDQNLPYRLVQFPLMEAYLEGFRFEQRGNYPGTATFTLFDPGFNDVAVTLLATILKRVSSDRLPGFFVRFQFGWRKSGAAPEPGNERIRDVGTVEAHDASETRVKSIEYQATVSMIEQDFTDNGARFHLTFVAARNDHLHERVHTRKFNSNGAARGGDYSQITVGTELVGPDGIYTRQHRFNYQAEFPRNGNIQIPIGELDPIRISDIVLQIAAELNLKPVVYQTDVIYRTLADPADYLIQRNQTNVEFLTQLAAEATSRFSGDVSSAVLSELSSQLQDHSVTAEDFLDKTALPTSGLDPKTPQGPQRPDQDKQKTSWIWHVAGGNLYFGPDLNPGGHFRRFVFGRDPAGRVIEYSPTMANLDVEKVVLGDIAGIGFDPIMKTWNNVRMDANAAVRNANPVGTGNQFGAPDSIVTGPGTTAGGAGDPLRKGTIPFAGRLYVTPLANVEALRRYVANRVDSRVSSVIGGTLVVLGDPTISLGDQIEVLVFDHRGMQHASSSRFFARQVLHDIRSGAFTTTIVLSSGLASSYFPEVVASQIREDFNIQNYPRRESLDESVRRATTNQGVALSQEDITRPGR